MSRIIKGPQYGAGYAAKYKNGSSAIKPVGDSRPQGRENYEGNGTGHGHDSDLSGGEIQVIKVKVKVGQKNSQYSKIDKILGTKKNGRFQNKSAAHTK